ncbi:MAG TPA: Asp-tRNA(Asn)/Glu-tRNA(Gln) amidotransferase subunit GatA [Candidatus Nanoarchaeia archaeon]|nr:Asp-tRNA(Asn)/Glu-tRNA(Gln) amidotransferase subunit GatA [Candidatus Nanoarchaeia archaeon]
MTTHEKLKKYLEEIKKNDQHGKKINAFIQLRPEDQLLKEAKEIDAKIKSGKAGKLAGKIIGIKACINISGLKSNCASKTLDNYKATFDATVVKKIKDEDGIIIGVCNMDEFACGSSGETSVFGPTKNPMALELVPGGSSSGSAASVAAGFCDIALGTDTGGSVRNPSSHCGVVGLKPSYSSVSRYGLVDLGMSLDQIGPIGKSVNDVALIFDVIKGKDEFDSISKYSEELKLKNIDKAPKNITIGLLDFKISDSKIQDLINESVEKLARNNGWKIKKVKMDMIDLAVQTYYPIVYVEFFSGTRKFDGRRYGKKIEESCGPEVLRRILGGSEITKEEYGGRYYHRALKAKKLIEKEFEKTFKDVDCIISPTVPRLPHKIGEKISIEDMYSYDLLTVPANLAGICAISIPAGKINNVPVGMQIMCDKFQEQKMFQIAVAAEKLNTG